MATIKPFLDNRDPRRSGYYPVVIKVSHRGKSKHLPTGYSIQEKHWDAKKVSGKHPDAGIINARIAELTSEAETYIADCILHGKQIRIEVLGTGKTSNSFTGYLQVRVAHYKAKKSFIQARKVERYITELKECFGADVYFEDINKDALRKYEEHLINNGNVGYTRLRKFGRLRQLFNNAIEEGKASAPNPFQNYHIASAPPKKEKLTEKEVEELEKLVIPAGPINDARNLFLFSYYCKGARFENCVMMLKAHIKNDRISWRINKGKRLISVKIHSKLQAILDQYKDHQGAFIFPYADKLRDHRRYGPAIKNYINKGGEVLEGKETSHIKMIDVLNVTIGRCLDEIARQLEWKDSLNFHKARHSFAFHLKKRTDSISVIQDSLGHKDQRTTEIYLQSLDDEQLDVEMRKLYGD